MINLLPCPFCGGEGDLQYDNSVDDSYSIMCGNCCAEGSTQEKKSHAIKLWNTRYKLTPYEDYIRGFEDARKQIIELSYSVNYVRIKN